MDLVYNFQFTIHHSHLTLHVSRFTLQASRISYNFIRQNINIHFINIFLALRLCIVYICDVKNAPPQIIDLV